MVGSLLLLVLSSFHDTLILNMFLHKYFIVRVNTRVIKIDTEAKTISAIDETQPNSQFTTTYDQLVLAVGSEPLKPPIPGINRDGLFALRNLQDMDAIVSWITMVERCDTCSQYETGIDGSAHGAHHAVGEFSCRFV